ncbi:MAG: response regulator [Candidatus Latescibacteria bacterium]|nr:response regulator [Candidatus Latescibacterota bacterium]
MKSILIVEDDVNLGELVKFRLQQNDYSVIVVTDGMQMFEQLRQTKPDLIILDVMLPKIDGFKLCGLLKNYDPYKEIPIIMFTARSGEESRLMAKETGCDAYITKPFDNKILLDKIAELLKRSEITDVPAPPAAD